MPGTFVFDAYGTLFDVHSAIGRHREAVGEDAAQFSSAWRTKQLEYTWTLTLAGQYVGFWDLTKRALDYAMALYPAVDRKLRQPLLDSYYQLGPFTDAEPLLSLLKNRGHRTAVLSNGSTDMLTAAVDGSGFAHRLDDLFSVDAVRAYKPRPEVYRLVTGTYAISPDDVIFVSSNRWDIMGAAAFGFRTLWVNRARLPEEYADYAPARVIAGLQDVTQFA